MTSENDGEPMSSSESGCSSLKSAVATGSATATAGKGILVHCNSKKSSNTNRVSFVTNSSSRCTSSASTASSLASSSSTSAKRSNNKNNNNKQNADKQRLGTHSDDEQSYYGRTGRQLTGFGIKSYLHDFYDDPENRDDSFQDDDFKYCVEPEIRWRRHCGGTCTAFGMALVAIGAVAMAVGHLMPARDPVVGRSANIEVIDRWAVAYNENLASCRYVGSVVLAVGVVFTVVRFWISVIRGVNGDDERSAAERKLGRGDQTPSSVNHHHQQPVRIPITGSVENVQPDPRAINLQFGDSSS